MINSFIRLSELLFPEFDRVIEPALGDCSRAYSEAVPQTLVNVKFGVDTERAHTVDTRFHCPPVCYMLVADSIYSACKYYEIFQSRGFRQCAIITSFVPLESNLRTESEDAEEFEKYEIYKKMLNGQTAETFEAEVKRKFIEEPAQMKLLIVVDKLLTGFDAPPCTFLYVDKSMHDHGLFQAICRVNRLDGEDKDFGYIVDYKQLFGDLKSALNKYTSGAFEGYDAEDIEGLIKDRLGEARKYLDLTLEELDDKRPFSYCSNANGNIYRYNL